MEKVVECECGFEASGVDDEALVEAARRHAAEVHDVTVSPELVLALARPSRRVEGR